MGRGGEAEGEGKWCWGDMKRRAWLLEHKIMSMEDMKHCNENE